MKCCENCNESWVTEEASCESTCERYQDELEEYRQAYERRRSLPMRKKKVAIAMKNKMRELTQHGSPRRTYE